MAIKEDQQALHEVELVTFDETKVAVLEHKGAPYLLGKSIQTFISWCKENALPLGKSRTFNLIYDDPRITPPMNAVSTCAVKLKGRLRQMNKE